MNSILTKNHHLAESTVHCWKIRKQYTLLKLLATKFEMFQMIISLILFFLRPSLSLSLLLLLPVYRSYRSTAKKALKTVQKNSRKIQPVVAPHYTRDVITRPIINTKSVNNAQVFFSRPKEPCLLILSITSRPVKHGRVVPVSCKK